MNPLLIIRSVVELVQSLKSTQETIKAEAEEFDAEAGVKTSPGVKSVAHVTIWGKVILLGMVAGDLPILDWFDLDGSEVFEWGAVICVCGAGVLGLVSHWNSADKDDQRESAHQTQAIEQSKQRTEDQRQRRQRRKDSDFLPNL